MAGHAGRPNDDGLIQASYMISRLIAQLCLASDVGMCKFEAPGPERIVRFHAMISKFLSIDIQQYHFDKVC